MAKPAKEISRILRTFAVPKETRKTGSKMLNLTDKNSEKTSIELYIQALGTKKLKKNAEIEGYRKKRPGRKTCGFLIIFLIRSWYQLTSHCA
jgi:hypothetical protein